MVSGRVVFSSLFSVWCLASQATVLFDSQGFESYSPGLIVGQDNWLPDFPGDHVFRVVNNSSATNKRLRVTRETSGNSFSQVYRFIRYTPSAGQIVKLSVDMSRSGSSTTFGYLELNLPDSIGGAATRVGISRLPGAAFSRAFVQAPYNSTTGQFEVGQPLRLVQLGNPLASGQSLRIEAFLNYTTKKIDLKLDGVSATGGYTIPFRNQTSADLNVLGMIASGFGTNDVADADNLKIEVVPEPSSLAVIAVGTLACMRQGRRRSRKS